MIALTPLQFKVLKKLRQDTWKVLQGSEAKAGTRLCNPVFSGGSRYAEKQPHPGNPSRIEYRLTKDGAHRLKFEKERRGA